MIELNGKEGTEKGGPLAKAHRFHAIETRLLPTIPAFLVGAIPVFIERSRVHFVFERNALLLPEQFLREAEMP